MLLQSVHYSFSPENADRAAALLRELRDLSRAEPGVAGFEVLRSGDRPGAFALWERYRDEAAFEAHLASEHFQRLVVNGVRRLADERSAEKGEPLP